jgi:hypothetical protein
MKRPARRQAFLFAAFAAALYFAVDVMDATAGAPERAAPDSAVPAHEISVRIDPGTQMIEGRDAITFGSRRTATLLLSARMRVDSIAADGRRIEPSVTITGSVKRIALPPARRVEVRWSGALAALDRGLDHRATLEWTEPASGAEGTFLPSGSLWYPSVDGTLERYRLSLDLPEGQFGLVPGRLLEERIGGGRYRARFEFDEPTEGITLIAGPYRIEERSVRTAAGSRLLLRTYFHAEIAGLAAGYLDSVASYIDLYEKRIGAYPFASFSVVSSPTPTGFGMPTMTYLGIEVLRLPFIRFTSLGHEVLHNWWGNGVYPDLASGNWSEGLTTFMADYAYREREGAQAAALARLAWLRDYAAMPASEDSALLAFTSRTHGASQIIGYHKAAMLFYMLRDEIGEVAFERALQRFWREQRFRRASWYELRAAFEQESGRSLGVFFRQWLSRTGAPEPRITAARAERQAEGWRVSVTLSQGTPAYVLSVPIAIRTSQGETLKRVELSRESDIFVLDVPSEPLAVVLDPQMQLFRRLSPAEAPPILRQAMLSLDAEMIVLSSDEGVKRAASELAAQLFERMPRDVPSNARSTAATIFVAGGHNEVDAWLAREGLPPRPAMLAARRGSAQVWMVPGSHDGSPPRATAIAIVSARDAKALSDLLRPLPHYGRQSYLVFDGAQAIERGVWPPQPQEWRLEAQRGAN